MSRKKIDVMDEDLVEKIEQDQAPGAYEVVVEDYVADGPSDKEGPVIEIEPPKVDTGNEFGVDLSHMTPSARERTLAEMREGARRIGREK